MSATATPEKPVAAAAPEMEIPDVIERLPKPDKAAHDAEIARLDAEIKQLQQRTAEIRAEMDKLKTGRSGYGEQIQAAKAVYNQLRSEKDNLIQQRNQLTAQIKATHEKKDATIKTQRSARAGLRFQTVEEYDAEIDRLRHQQETRSMSLNEEKQLVKEIEALQKQKRQTAGLTDDKGEVDKHSDSIKELRALQAQKNAEIDAVQAKLAAQKIQLDELYRLNEEEKKQDKFPHLAKERKEIKEQLDAKFTELKELRAAFKAANDRYYENIRMVRRKKELERKQEEERRRQEYEARLAEYEKEMAKIHPYQDEMDLCDALTAFLEKTFAKELKEAAAGDDDGNARSSAPVTAELDGLKPLQRKEEDFIMLGKKGRKGRKDGSGRRAKRDAKVSLPLAQLEAYSTIGLVPPATNAALATSLSAIKEKRTWFHAQTTRPKASKAPAVETTVTEPVTEPATTRKASPTTKKPSNRGGKLNVADTSAFPTLGAASAASSSFPGAGTFAASAWGPGMAVLAPAPVFVEEESAE